MKRITPFIFLLYIAACEITVPYHGTVTDKCMAENYNKYYGDCIWQVYSEHPNTQDFIEAYNFRTDWKELSEINNNMIELVADEAITIQEANLLFMTKFNMIVKKDEARLEERDKALSEFSEKMNEISERRSGIYKDTILKEKKLTSSRYLGNGKYECKYGLGINETIVISRTCDSFIYKEE